MAPQLAAEGVSVRFGGLTVILGVTLKLRRGEILGLIGPNGAGKTTLVNVLSGFQRPQSGIVMLGDRDITRLRPEDRSRLGVIRTFQAVRLFHDLSVVENVEIAALARGLSRQDARGRALDALDRMGLGAHAAAVAGTLPYGLERRVGIARALVMRPGFLLLDEPAAGLNEAEGDELLAVIKRIREDIGCGVLLIEHNMRVVFGLCDRVHVLRSGATIAEGTPAEMRSDQQVREAYLGETQA